MSDDKLRVLAAAASRETGPMARPKIVCLCGSTRFYEAFQWANYRETMLGNIVLSVGFYPHSQRQAHGEEVGCTEEQKIALDELHLRKIDLADEMLVLNVGGYYGDSTAREIQYAHDHGKPVRFLEDNITREPPPEVEDAPEGPYCAEIEKDGKRLRWLVRHQGESEGCIYGTKGECEDIRDVLNRHELSRLKGDAHA